MNLHEEKYNLAARVGGLYRHHQLLHGTNVIIERLKCIYDFYRFMLYFYHFGIIFGTNLYYFLD